MSGPPAIAPVLVPHGACLAGCPYCEEEPRSDTWDLLCDPVAITEAVDRVLDRRLAQGHEPQAVEVAFYGGDLWQVPRELRTELLDAAEWEVRRGRASGIRITLSPRSVLRAPLAEFRARGVHTVEVPIHTLDRRVLRNLGASYKPRMGLEAIGRLNRARFRTVVHLTPGLPGSSHQSALQTADAVARARPQAARVLPALVLEETRLAAIYERSSWEPMNIDEAVTTVRHVLDRLRQEEVEVIRVGLQPENDLLRGPRLLAGPFSDDFRCRVESERMRVLAVDTLTSAFALGRRDFTFAVHPREESWLRGISNVNVRLLKEQFRLEALRILPSEEQPEGQLRVFAGELDEVPPLPPRRRAKRAS
ncbi:MAG: radical SAM protein [Myxococcota bacterium]|nr:radical SAM protein [Myxococcota bacterium]